MTLCWPKSRKRNGTSVARPPLAKQSCELCKEYIRLSCNGHAMHEYQEPMKESALIPRRDSSKQDSPSNPMYTFKFLKSLASKRTWMIAPNLRETYLTLDLHKKKLERVHENIFRFKDLKAICLNGNSKLTDLSGLRNLMTLRLIIAKDCNIGSLEKALPSRLIALDLYNNPKLMDFKEIQNLRRLKHLNIGRCCITRIPTEVPKLLQLTLLSLEDNFNLMQPITGLSSLIQLQVLLLRNCNLNEVPEDVYALNELVYLSVEQNKISEIPSKITRMNNLRVLSIYGNRGIVVNRKVVRLPNLQRINVDLNFSTKSISIKLKKLVQIWKDIPCAWWKQL